MDNVNLYLFEVAIEMAVVSLGDEVHKNLQYVQWDGRHGSPTADYDLFVNLKGKLSNGRCGDFFFAPPAICISNRVMTEFVEQFESPGTFFPVETEKGIYYLWQIDAVAPVIDIESLDPFPRSAIEWSQNASYFAEPAMTYPIFLDQTYRSLPFCTQLPDGSKSLLGLYEAHGWSGLNFYPVQKIK